MTARVHRSASRAASLAAGVCFALFGLACGDDEGTVDPDAAVAQGAGRDAQTSVDPVVGGDGGSTAQNGLDGASAAGDASQPASGSAAAQVARRLGRDHFLIGLGNDLDNDHDKDGAYGLGTTLDLHYAYLVGLKGRGGWTDWNDNGSFVNILTDSAKKHGVVPMFTLYSMAAAGEANSGVLVDDSYMGPYWEGAKLLFQRLGMFDGPAVVHFEPDWWAYAQQASHGDPSTLPTHVTSLAPDCAGLPNDISGMGKCLVVLARKYAPKTLVGFHASEWADGDPAKIGEFLAKIGGAESDILFIDMLDRDAGCFEAHVDPNCQRGGTTGWYWDEQNRTSPNFSEHLAKVRSIAGTVGKPVMWWQLPLGVASDTPGGSAGHYRDNRVKYLFSHVSEFVAAGGVGAVFGVGTGNQTTVTTDDGQFQRAAAAYFAAPTKL